MAAEGMYGPEVTHKKPELEGKKLIFTKKKKDGFVSKESAVFLRLDLNGDK